MVVTRSQRRTPSPPPNSDTSDEKGNGEYPTPARVRVFQLREELGYSADRVKEETGIPIRTQSYWLRSRSERRTGRRRPDRPSKLSGDILDKIIKEFEGRYSIRRLDYETQIKRYDVHVCVKTLKKALHDRGIHKYLAAHKRWLQKKDCERRLIFAKAMLKWPA